MKSAPRLATLGSWFNHAEGTLWTEAIAPQGVDPTVTGYIVWQIDDNSAANRHNINRFNTRVARALTLNANVATGQIIGTAAWNDLAMARVAYAYRQDDFSLVSHGAAAVLDTSGTVPASGLNTIRIGPHSGGTYFNGYVRRIAYYNYRLSNNEMQAITL